MQIPQVSRSPLKIKYNNLPENYMGIWLSDEFRLECRIKPPYDDTTVMLEVCPAFLVFDAETKNELFRFQTETIFSFSGNHSKTYIRGLIHHLTCLSVEEFNESFQNTKSLFAIHRLFEKPTIQQIEPYVIETFKTKDLDNLGITPFWKKIVTKTEEENEIVISSFPRLPDYKTFKGKNPTEEQIALSHILQTNTATERDINTIRKAILFYKECFTKLQQIDLSILTDLQCEKIKKYLGSVLTINPIMNNEINLGYIYRVTVVEGFMLEGNKVRSKNFLKYPPLKFNKRNGVYNRANSPDSSLFYASSFPSVALQETHPSKGKRVIISTWAYKSALPLTAFPLCLTAGIPNEYADKNNYAFEQMHDILHPVVFELFECFFTFFTSEFIKAPSIINPKRYEYLFSAIFSEKLLTRMPKNTNFQNFDCIVFPSVAWNHLPDNFAILPKIINKNFALIDSKEYEVEETFYDKEVNIEEFPARLRLIRSSSKIDHTIVHWDDD